MSKIPIQTWANGPVSKRSGRRFSPPKDQNAPQKSSQKPYQTAKHKTGSLLPNPRAEKVRKLALHIRLLMPKRTPHSKSDAKNQRFDFQGIAREDRVLAESKGSNPHENDDSSAHIAAKPGRRFFVLDLQAQIVLLGQLPEDETESDQ